LSFCFRRAIRVSLDGFDWMRVEYPQAQWLVKTIFLGLYFFCGFASQSE